MRVFFVSILVLLDFVLKGGGKLWISWVGCGVSILVLLDFVLKVEGKESYNKVMKKFQSLFYWILFLRLLYSEDLRQAHYCFNPCFIGFCS